MMRRRPLLSEAAIENLLEEDGDDITDPDVTGEDDEDDEEDVVETTEIIFNQEGQVVAEYGPRYVSKF
jgi:hypothetical protein